MNLRHGKNFFELFHFEIALADAGADARLEGSCAFYARTGQHGYFIAAFRAVNE